MDIELEKRLDETIAQLRHLSVDDIDFNQLDPVAKMMLVALIGEVQKIRDQLESVSQRIVDRYCSTFIPWENVEAVPSIVLINPTFKHKKDIGLINVGKGASFTFRNISQKLLFNYIPVFNTAVIPHSKVFVLTHQKMSFGEECRSISMGKGNRVWLGIVSDTEIESLRGVSLLIKGTNGISPEHIYVGQECKEMDFTTMRDMEKIEMVEPFDSQQSSGELFSFINVWREFLLNMDEASLIYLTDETVDRDLFKPRPYPKVFQQWLEDETLDCFDSNTLWLQLDFPEGYTVPETFDVVLNVVPVANVDINQVTLTQTSPIAKLQKQEDSFFLKIIEASAISQKQGFNKIVEEIIIRDYDAACYHNGDLYRDVRNLYNRFVDDYYAFIEYNSIKDGEVLKQLRETINKLGKSVGDKNAKYKFDSGTYVMKNMSQYPQSQSIKVSYMTTQGRKGNTPQVGDFMENKKIPAIELKVPVVVSGMGGADKATADERYEQLRYYSLTNDRLYTKMDIEAFLRKEIMAEFGKEEFKRIYIKINIEGIGGTSSLQRGLYIDIEFKDKKNYEKAVNNAFDKLMKQKIEGKSCIAMPINIELRNNEVL